MYISVGHRQYSRFKYNKWRNLKFIFSFPHLNDDVLGKKGRQLRM